MSKAFTDSLLIGISFIQFSLPFLSLKGRRRASCCVALTAGARVTTGPHIGPRVEDQFEIKTSRTIVRLKSLKNDNGPRRDNDRGRYTQ